jgi:rRNA maturation protein Rpf1
VTDSRGIYRISAPKDAEITITNIAKEGWTVSHDLSNVSASHPAFGAKAAETWKVHGDLPFAFNKTSNMDHVNFTMFKEEA